MPGKVVCRAKSCTMVLDEMIMQDRRQTVNAAAFEDSSHLGVLAHSANTPNSFRFAG